MTEPTNRKRILVVNEDHEFIELSANTLKAAGHDVGYIESNILDLKDSQVIKTLQDLKPDIVLWGISWPPSPQCWGSLKEFKKTQIDDDRRFILLVADEDNFRLWLHESGEEAITDALLKVPKETIDWRALLEIIERGPETQEVKKETQIDQEGNSNGKEREL